MARERIPSNMARCHGIGKFFVELALAILHGEKQPVWYPRGDIYDHRKKIVIEVKGSSNHHVPALYCKKIDDDIAERAYALNVEWYWYAIFFYRNSFRNKKILKIGKMQMVKELNEFLLKHVMCMYLLDVDVCSAIMERYPKKVMYRIGEMRELVPCSKSVLKGFETNPKEMLRRLNLQHRFSVVRRPVTVNFMGRQLKFSIISVLPRSQQKYLDTFFIRHQLDPTVKEEEFVLARAAFLA